METNKPVFKTEAPEVDGLDMLSLIGEGASGQVWKAKAKCCRNLCIFDTDYHNPNISLVDGVMAVKIFRRQKNGETRPIPAGLNLNEIYIMNRLSFEAGPETPIVRSLGVGNTSARERCLKMEFCYGGNLREFLNRRKSNHEANLLTEPEAAMVAKQIAKALYFCHRNSVLHLDVKPENILFRQGGDDRDRLGSACLTDFSISLDMKNKNSSYKLAAGIGSAHYIAPEMAGCMSESSIGIYSVSADAWSLGVVLLESLTGLRPPLDGPGFDHIKRQLVYTDPACRGHGSWIDTWMKQDNLSKGQRWMWETGLSDDAKDVIRQLLEPNHTRRLTIDGFLRCRWLRQNLGDGYRTDNGLMCQVKNILSWIGLKVDLL